jgi:DNA-binding transcriptional LysR family regulator
MSAELLNRYGGALQGPGDLLRLPLIEIEDDLPGDTAGTWDRWFEFAGGDLDAVTAAPVMVVAYIDQSMQAAARGQGVVLARRPFREDMVAAGQLMMPFPELRRPTGYATFLIVSKNSRGRKPVGQLRNWLLEELARPPKRQS